MASQRQACGEVPLKVDPKAGTTATPEASDTRYDCGVLVAAAATLIVCWQPESMAPEASQDVSVGEGMLVTSVRKSE